MSDIKLIVFDWDGTLSDSADRIVQAIHVATKVVGLPTLSDQDVKNIIGLGLVESFRELFPVANLDEVYEPFNVAYRDAYLDSGGATATLFDGAIETLDALRTNYTLAVATGKSRAGLDRELEETGIGSYFAATRCADETKPKPDPLMLHEIFEATGIGAENTVMIGDTDHDVNTARNAGAVPVVVTCGAQLLPRLEAAEPSAIFNNVTELPVWLRNLSTGDL